MQDPTKDARFKLYRKKMIQPIRPYEPGEDMTGISVYDGDVLEEGGGVAYNPNNLKDQWYISKQFMANYEEVPSD